MDASVYQVLWRIWVCVGSAAIALNFCGGALQGKEVRVRSTAQPMVAPVMEPEQRPEFPDQPLTLAEIMDLIKDRPILRNKVVSMMMAGVGADALDNDFAWQCSVGISHDT